MTSLDACPPVLLVGFNRPELMREQVNRLRAVRPTRLYVACDGPRSDRPDEAALTSAVQATVDLVDWPCRVETLFQVSNLGCGPAVSTAISWFLSNESAGVILEDDVVASPDFFRFAGDMLTRYANDRQVWTIGGLSLDPPALRQRQRESYRFTSMPLIWGWATWARTWESYRLDISDWSDWLDLGSIARDQRWPTLLRLVIRKRIADVASGKVNTWDTQLWTLGMAEGAVHVMPNSALTTNAGVFVDATHSGYEPTQLRSPEPLRWPLTYPTSTVVDVAADRALLTDFFEGTWTGYGRKAWRRMAPHLPGELGGSR